MEYELSHITEVVQSGWTGDIFVDEPDAFKAGFDSVVTFAGEDFHAALTALVATWERTETEDGGVITYRRPS